MQLGIQEEVLHVYNYECELPRVNGEEGICTSLNRRYGKLLAKPPVRSYIPVMLRTQVIDA